MLSNLGQGLPRVMGHAAQLLEVIVNLVSNAIDAMKSVEGRERMLTMESRFDVARGLALLAVRDTGPGIDPAKSHEIFDPFVTTKRHGMGLGLAICRRILESHGGQISAGSGGETRGAIFQLGLPATPYKQN